MSAEVETEFVHIGICTECGTASIPYDTEPEAEEWAATHNAECHEPDDGEDENYERFKESRYED